MFELAAGSTTITTLASFNGTGATGRTPRRAWSWTAAAISTAQPSGGGANGDGTVFEMKAGSNTITTLASFNGTNGAGPTSGLIMDSSGNLYGTTTSGGANGDGTVFEMAAGSNTITTLASFDGTNGAAPESALIMDGSGNLYGTNQNGGA